MDKFIEGKWFSRIVALMLAMLLFTSVYMEENEKNKASGEKNDPDVIEDVEVEVYYDRDKYVVTGVPETVDVYIEGSNSIVQRTKVIKDFTVYVDLTNAKIGNQKVDIKYRDISDQLTVVIKPSTVTVNVQEKITKEFEVEGEFNQAVLEEGYKAETPIVEPNTVRITGAKDIIDRISYVKATVNIDGPINETFTQKAKIQVLDRDLNKLDVIVEPENVEVTVPVILPKKTVPITIKQKGEPKEGVMIKEIKPEVNEITLHGGKKELDKIERLELPVDVTGISSNKKITIPIELPKGIISSEPESITVDVIVEKVEEEAKLLSNLTIEPKGLSEGYSLSFLNPKEGKTSLKVFGPLSYLKNISSSNIQLYLDLSKYTIGEHEVDVQVKAPKNITWELAMTKAKISITEKSN